MRIRWSSASSVGACSRGRPFSRHGTLALSLSLSQNSIRICTTVCFLFARVLRPRTELRKYMMEGSAWVLQTTAVRCALPLSKASKLNTTRLGNNAARTAERFRTQAKIRVGEGAASLRALAAAADYLATDRPEIPFATKELCRCLASHTTDSADM